MNSSRRQFLQNLSMLAGGLAIAPGSFAFSKNNPFITPDLETILSGVQPAQHFRLKGHGIPMAVRLRFGILFLIKKAK
jgi:hypothetical protein